jgi:hypothetical protein
MNSMEYRILKVGFQLPDNGIPMIGEWDESNGVLQFDIENACDVDEHYPKDEVDYAVKWAQSNSINCVSEEMGNRHLSYLGVRERLEAW